MNKKLISSLSLIVLLIVVVIAASILTQSATAENTKIWANDFKGDYDGPKKIGMLKPPKQCECSAATKLGDSLNYVWNCRCGSKQCVVAGRYDGSNMSCFKFVESLLK